MIDSSWNYVQHVFPIIDPVIGKNIDPKRWCGIECVHIPIPSETMLFCRELARRKEMGYWKKSPSNYREGAYKGNDLVGFLGEAAVGLYFNLFADWEYRRRGDEGVDFLIGEKKVDVKTSLSARWHRNFIIRQEGKTGELKELSSDLYIGGYVESERSLEEDKSVTVILIGFAPRHVLEEQSLVPSPKFPECWNTEMYFSSLIPIRILMRYYERYQVSNNKNPS